MPSALSGHAVTALYPQFLRPTALPWSKSSWEAYTPTREELIWYSTPFSSIRRKDQPQSSMLPFLEATDLPSAHRLGARADICYRLTPEPLCPRPRPGQLLSALLGAWRRAEDSLDLWIPGLQLHGVEFRERSLGPKSRITGASALVFWSLGCLHSLPSFSLISVLACFCP